MKKNLIINIIIFLILSSSFALAYESPLPDPLETEGWEEVRNIEGISIYTRPWPGSSFLAIKSIFIINASIEQNIAAAIDDTAYKDWIMYLMKFEKFNVESMAEFSFYSAFEFPPFLSNRDNAFDVTFDLDKKTGIVTYVFNDNVNYPHKEGFIRVTENYSMWVFIPLNDGRTKVIQQIHSEPGGWIPAWIVNWGIDEMAIKTIKLWKKHSTKEKYKNSPVFSQLFPE